MGSFMHSLFKFAKKSKYVRRVYNETVLTYLNTHIGEITPMNARILELKDKRINLVVPSINQEHIFGGISTAIQFFNLIASNFNYQRIILSDAAPGSEDLHKFPEYELVHSSQDSQAEKQIVAFNDRYGKTLPVSQNDIFIATSWWTAYAVQRLIEWQTETYEIDIPKMIYFIQDYEPGFYQWSSQYVLAESTYRFQGPQIAVFNSGLLHNYFKNNHYSFYQEYSFEPQINKSLKPYLSKVKGYKKKKQLLIYGRPSVARNAFQLIVEALRIWVWKQPDAKEWSIISAGEFHQDIDLGNGVTIFSKGKMTLDDYAQVLLDSSIGISLMVSPHPSYPPLEMAHFGVKVLTNNYENKNLSDWNSNIMSINSVNPNNIANELLKMIHVVESQNFVGSFTPNLNYVESKEQFEFIKDILKEI